MAELGYNIIVMADNKAICGTKVNTILCDCETIEIASADDNAWVHKIAGRKTWSVTADFLLVAATSGNMSVSIGNLLSVGSVYTLLINTRNGSVGVTGTAILKTMQLQGAVGSLATGSWKFEGSGALALSY